MQSKNSKIKNKLWENRIERTKKIYVSEKQKERKNWKVCCKKYWNTQDTEEIWNLPEVMLATVALCEPILTPKLGFRNVMIKFFEPYNNS